MSISSRNQRATVHPYTPANDGGYITSAYGPARNPKGHWCRVSPIVGDETTVGDQAEHRERCIFEFSDEVTIAHDDYIVQGSDAWKVESVTLRRASRAKVVYTYRTDDEPAAPVTTDLSVLDGGGANGAFGGYIDGGNA